MANEEQLAILHQGVDVWNKWRDTDPVHRIYLSGANLSHVDLRHVNFSYADLTQVNLSYTDLRKANLSHADISGSNLTGADVGGANLWDADLSEADLSRVNFAVANLWSVRVKKSNFSNARVAGTFFGKSDLSEAIGLEYITHYNPSTIGMDTIATSRGKVPEVFLRGCGLSDWEIEEAKLYNPELNNEEINKILYRIYDLRAIQALQISPLFISYSHADTQFVDKIESQLNSKGIRFWRDIHDMKAGRIENQIDQAISQNRTVLLVLSENSIKSDWVEHEVRTARGLEKDMGRDVLCPIALDDSWKSSPWPKRVMEQIMEYNILDFSAWEDEVKFEGMFRKLIDGLELFYKG